MVRNRSTEIWHIPKRGSIHQMVGSLNVIKHYEIDGKGWPGSRKKFDQKLAIWGFTSRGRSISKNASETLEAMLKYLGLLCIDKNKKIRITQVGLQFIKENPLKEPIVTKRKLNETIKEMGNIKSDVIMHQMIKLILTNPTILRYCQNLNISPFRETLILLLDNQIQHLSSEEMAMFLFKMHDKSERTYVKKQILNFRKLGDGRKEKIIDEFKDTNEGKLTLAKAPTATYWKQHCSNTGLCNVIEQNLLINNRHKALKLLGAYEDNVYDFNGNIPLWYAYYTVPARKLPVDITINPSIEGYDEYLLKISNKTSLIGGELLSKDLVVNLPVFPDEEHLIEVKELQNGNSLYSEIKKFDHENTSLQIEVDSSNIIHGIKPDIGFYLESIKELVKSKTVDEDYLQQLIIISENLNIDFSDKMPLIRGGRLEYLFFKSLEILQEEGKISELKWNGKLIGYGIAYPAPGTQRGLSDITFKCNNTYFLLELTTVKSASAQWRAEGSSVPFHIRNFDSTNSKKVVGIFAAPIIYQKIDEAIKSSLMPHRYIIISLSIDDLLKIIFESEAICDELNEKIKEQYEKIQSL